MNTAAHARALLAQNRYVVIASADGDGSPWVTPVWFAPDGLDRMLWISWPGSRHSRLIATRAEIALTVFDSHAPPGGAAAFYATAHAGECTDDHLDAAVALLNERANEQGLDAFSRGDLTGAARLRVYVATIHEAWVLDQDASVDQRAPVPR